MTPSDPIAGRAGFPRFASIALLAVLCSSILTIWVEGRWAVSLLESGVFALGLLWAFWSVSERHAFRPIWVQGALAGIVAIGLAQLAFDRTIYRWATWNAVLHWSMIWVLFTVTLAVARQARERRRLLRGALWFSAALASLATLQQFTAGGKIFWLFPSGYTDFVLGSFVYRNQYAAFLELALPLALWLAVAGKERRLVYAAMAAVLFASMVGCASRAGFVLSLLEIGLVVAIAWRRKAVPGRAVLVGVALFGLLALSGVAVAGWQTLENRFREPEPYKVRGALLASTVRMVRERPWWGFGLGTWAAAYPRFATYDDGTFVNQAHNDWAQWCAEGGLPMLALLLAIGIGAGGRTLRSGWGVGIPIFLLHATVDYPMQQRPALAAWFFFWLALSQAGAGTRPAEADTDDLLR
jgi:O-antigen ligase